MFNDWNAAAATPSPCNTQRTKGIYVYFVLCEYGMIILLYCFTGDADIYACDRSTSPQRIPW